MRVLILPFFSAQDKVTGQQLSDVCVVTKLCLFMDKKLREEGRESVVVLPSKARTNGLRIPYDVLWVEGQTDNVSQRRRPPVVDTRGFDVMVCHNETAPSLHARPGLRVISVNHVPPFGPWEWARDAMVDGWQKSSAVVVHSETRAKMVLEMSGVKSHVIKFGWDDTEVIGKRDVDFVFVHRCSTTNYSQHLRFMTLAEKYKGRAKFVMADPTNLLTGCPFVERPSSRYEYFNLLQRSRFVVCSVDDMHGGVAPREAVAMGCVPVVLPGAYDEMVGDHYPLTYDDETVERLVVMLERNREESLSESWKKFRRLL